MCFWFKRKMYLHEIRMVWQLEIRLYRNTSAVTDSHTHPSKHEIHAHWGAVPMHSPRKEHNSTNNCNFRFQNWKDDIFCSAGRVDCSSDNMVIVIQRSYLNSLGLSSNDLYVDNHLCRPSISSTEVVFSFPLDACGTTKEVWPTRVRSSTVPDSTDIRVISRFSFTIAENDHLYHTVSPTLCLSFLLDDEWLCVLHQQCAGHSVSIRRNHSSIRVLATRGLPNGARHHGADIVQGQGEHQCQHHRNGSLQCQHSLFHLQQFLPTNLWLSIWGEPESASVCSGQARQAWQQPGSLLGHLCSFSKSRWLQRSLLWPAA